MDFLETSAVTGLNVDEAFFTLIRKIKSQNEINMVIHKIYQTEEMYSLVFKGKVQPIQFILYMYIQIKVC